MAGTTMMTQAQLANFRPIDTIIIHCSDSPDDNDKVNAAEIARWHRIRGFKTIGYHFVILRDGTVELGRHLNTIGAHCKGHNVASVGICWVGRNELTQEQRAAMLKLIKTLLATYKLSVSAVKGHREFDANKTCPNINPEELRRWVQEYLDGRVPSVSAK